MLKNYEGKTSWTVPGHSILRICRSTKNMAYFLVVPFVFLLSPSKWPAGWLDWPSSKWFFIRYDLIHIYLESARPASRPADLKLEKRSKQTNYLPKKPASEMQHPVGRMDRSCCTFFSRISIEDAFISRGGRKIKRIRQTETGSTLSHDRVFLAQGRARDESSPPGKSSQSRGKRPSPEVGSVCRNDKIKCVRVLTRLITGWFSLDVLEISFRSCRKLLSQSVWGFCLSVW